MVTTAAARHDRRPRDDRPPSLRVACDDRVVPERRLGYVLIVVATVLFGINAGVTRIPLSSGTSTGTFTSVRLTGAFCLLVLLATAVRRASLRPPRGRQVPLVVGLGLAGVLGVQWTYNVALTRLPLGVALLVEYLGPVIVVLWVRFARHEPVHARMWPALALCLSGLAVVGQVWRGLVFDPFGLLMALLAAFCLATYFLLGEHNVGPEAIGDPLRVVIWSFGAATLAINLLYPSWRADSLLVDASALGRFADVTVPAWMAMVWVIVFGTAVTFGLLLAALQMVPATRASIVAMLEPVTAAVVGWVWFAEELTPVQLAGAAALLCGIAVAQTARARPPGGLGLEVVTREPGA